MAVTNIIAKKLAQHLVQITVIADNSPLYWRLDGKRYHDGFETQLVISVEPGTSPIIWVSDSDYGDDADFFPGHASIQIFVDETSLPSYEFIRFEEFVSGVWTLRKKIRIDGSGWYSWTSRWLEDITSHQFRALPIGTNENNGTTVSLSILMVRNPDPPDVNWIYNGASTPTVTIEVA